MKVKLKDKYSLILFKNFIGGIGWALGVTIGFTLLISLFSFILNKLGGLPLIGEWIARLIEVTNQALELRKNLS